MAVTVAPVSVFQEVETFLGNAIASFGATIQSGAQYVEKDFAVAFSAATSYASANASWLGQQVSALPALVAALATKAGITKEQVEAEVGIAISTLLAAAKSNPAMVAFVPAIQNVLTTLANGLISTAFSSPAAPVVTTNAS